LKVIECIPWSPLVKFQQAEKYLFKGSTSNMENTSSLDAPLAK
jgi:hypothetical protein